MKPAVQYALIGVGGLVLLGGSFITFSALSGAPLHEVAILKHFVAAPEQADEPESSGSKSADGDAEHTDEPVAKEAGAHAPSPSKAEQRAIAANVGVLSAFSLPAPFSADELSNLQTSLRGATDEAQKRLQRAEARERELAEWEHALEQRKDELQELRRLLEKKELELSMREEEVSRDTRAKEERDQQSWADLARFFAEGDPEDLARKLVLFEPKEAVRILRALDDERAGALVNALPADKYHEYLQAYRAAGKP